MKGQKLILFYPTRKSNRFLCCFDLEILYALQEPNQLLNFEALKEMFSCGRQHNSTLKQTCVGRPRDPWMQLRFIV